MPNSYPYSDNEYIQKWSALCVHVKKKIPNNEILNKRSSFLMKIFSICLFFIEFYKFSSTFYPKIYLSDNMWKNFNNPNLPTDSKIRLITSICHEYVHLLDRKKMWILFDFLYLSPQIFMLGFLLIFITGNFWWLLALLFLSPVPSIGRTWIEFRGYRMSIAIRYWLTGKLDDSYIEYIISQFTTRSYYWMFPFRWFLQRMFANHIEKIKSNNIENLPKEIIEIRKVLDI